MFSLAESPLTLSPSESDLNMRYMDLDDLKLVMGWCKEEGWNVGQNDASIYYSIAPRGHMLFLKNDLPIGAISIFRHSKDFFTLGPFIVKKGYRSKGYGTKIWQKAMMLMQQELESATIALYSVPDQVGRYEKSGFHKKYNIQTWKMNNTLSNTQVDSECQLINNDNLSAVSLYDQSIFSASRKALLSKVIKLPSATGFMLKEEQKIVGFGIIRPLIKAYRVGPLFADTPENAKKLFSKLLTAVGEVKIILDMPACNRNALLFASYFGLKNISKSNTHAMFKGEIGESFKNIDKHYGVFSLEIG